MRFFFNSVPVSCPPVWTHTETSLILFFVFSFFFNLLLKYYLFSSTGFLSLLLLVLFQCHPKVINSVLMNRIGRFWCPCPWPFAPHCQFLSGSFIIKKQPWPVASSVGQCLSPPSYTEHNSCHIQVLMPLCRFKSLCCSQCKPLPSSVNRQNRV